MNAIKRRVVCVEDEPEMIDLYRLILNRRGFEVIGADGGREGLEAIRQHLPELVLLDLMMPDIDGYEICRRLRAHRRTEDVPIIFLTERRERIDRLTGLELGAVDYITKPFDIQELRLRVRNALGVCGHRGGKQRARARAESDDVEIIRYLQFLQRRL